MDWAGLTYKMRSCKQSDQGCLCSECRWACPELSANAGPAWCWPMWALTATEQQPTAYEREDWYFNPGIAFVNLLGIRLPRSSANLRYPWLGLDHPETRLFTTKPLCDCISVGGQTNPSVLLNLRETLILYFVYTWPGRFLQAQNKKRTNWCVQCGVYYSGP